MTINAHTKIAHLIKHHPDALEAIVSISQKFARLRNPVMRKLIAGRTSISMASKLGGCSIEDFFNRLQPLGFEIDRSMEEEKKEIKPTATFLKNIATDQIIDFDVRPIISGGDDPLNAILKKVKDLEKGSVLKIINSFEPTPLIHLLGRQGFETYTEEVEADLVNTYFYKISDEVFQKVEASSDDSTSWEDIWKRFEGKMQTVDVRELPMPMPMHTILDALQTLKPDNALFVLHKRIPVFLLQELDEQGFSYRVKEISEGQVELLIYKD